MPFGNMGGWSFVILVVIILLLFGAPRLPRLAKSLGESMRIFKGEMKTMKNDSPGEAKPTPASEEAPEGEARRESAADPKPSDGSDTSTR
ncbi:Sec-independent protein translocase subunit TatA [Gulosibacter sp. 10]|uniref:Sec-independent protein translocase subunit TatA n=1 Tax=Gulosibacter sp. 10 TaxID=1255570 RepID=UPI00097ED22D|nr:Sec-independent protein translocase subunit TatA [Gulosibacter sp. 10]SJM52814.1 Twin-arginine translocation protein TatA [Gulosibacter sp. 10]